MEKATNTYLVWIIQLITNKQFQQIKYAQISLMVGEWNESEFKRCTNLIHSVNVMSNCQITLQSFRFCRPRLIFFMLSDLICFYSQRSLCDLFHQQSFSHWLWQVCLLKRKHMNNNAEFSFAFIQWTNKLQPSKAMLNYKRLCFQWQHNIPIG